MGAAFTHSSSSSTASNATSRTWAHDCTGDNYLSVFVNHRNDPDVNPTCTYNGTSAPVITTQAASFNWQSAFEQFNPSTGSNNIVASWTNSVNCGAVGMSASGVGTRGTAVKASVAGAAGVNYSTTGVTLGANDILFGATGYPDGPTQCSTITGTERVESPAGPDASLTASTNTGTGSTSLTWNYVPADPKTYIAFGLFAPTANTSNFLAFM